MHGKTNGKPRYRLVALIPVVAAFTLLWYYASLYEPQHPVLKKITIRDKALADVFGRRRVLFLSDLHIGSAKSQREDEVLAEIKRLKPDIIFLGGDYVRWSGRNQAAYEKALDFLAALDAPLGVYAVLGDADYHYSRKVCEFCHNPATYSPTSRHRVTILRNSGTYVDTGRGRVFIWGGDAQHDAGSWEASLWKAQAEDGPAILLSHSSIIFDALPNDKDMVVLAGDTHGGQVRLPGIFWRLTKRKPDPAHMYGLFRAGRKYLYVTSGVGTSWPHIRLGVPPEIVELEFTE